MTSPLSQMEEAAPEESLSLLRAFMKIKDGEARTQIIELAERLLGQQAAEECNRSSVIRP